MKIKSLVLAGALVSSPLYAADYVVDTKGAHASINFKISHLGYSYVIGRFEDFDGTFTYDSEAPENAKIEINIDTASVDSNHAERDKHIRGSDFLEVETYPEATFVSTGYTEQADGSGVLSGNLTLKGVTNPIEIETMKIGEGEDPWGGYRVGFEGSAPLTLKDYGIDYNLGPDAEILSLDLHIEGIRQ